MIVGGEIPNNSILIMQVESFSLIGPTELTSHCLAF